MKRNRFTALDGAVKSINRELEARARDLAGLKGYVTKRAACPDGTPVTPEFVIGATTGSGISRKASACQCTRPVYHHKRDSIEAHLTIVFAALVTFPASVRTIILSA